MQVLLIECAGVMYQHSLFGTRDEKKLIATFTNNSAKHDGTFLMDIPTRTSEYIIEPLQCYFQEMLSPDNKIYILITDKNYYVYNLDTCVLFTKENDMIDIIHCRMKWYNNIIVMWTTRKITVYTFDMVEHKLVQQKQTHLDKCIGDIVIVNDKIIIKSYGYWTRPFAFEWNWKYGESFKSIKCNGIMDHVERKNNKLLEYPQLQQYICSKNSFIAHFTCLSDTENYVHFYSEEYLEHLYTRLFTHFVYSKRTAQICEVIQADSASYFGPYMLKPADEENDDLSHNLYGVYPVQDIFLPVCICFEEFRPTNLVEKNLIRNIIIYM